MRSTLNGDRSIDFLYAICLWNLFKAYFDSLAKHLEAFLHAAYTLEQACIDQSSHWLPVLVDYDTVVPILNLVQHLAEVLSKGDGAGLGNHHFVSILIIMIIMV